MKNGIAKKVNAEDKTEELEWRWCLVGNIVEKHLFGENHEVKYGTKQFRPGAKIYLSQSHWGDGYENVNVIGKPRRLDKYVEIIMRREYITNFRLQKVFKPAVLKRMNYAEEEGWGGFWDNTDEAREEIIDYLDFLNPEEAKKEMEKMSKEKL